MVVKAGVIEGVEEGGGMSGSLRSCRELIREMSKQHREAQLGVGVA